MSRQDEEIIELNSQIKVTIAPSPIHGVGIFAIMDIQKGQKMYCKPEAKYADRRQWYHIPYGSLNKLFPEVRELVLRRWPSIINGSHFTSPNDCWPILWMNHSSDPEKVNYDPKTDTALADIKKGEEVFEDYRIMLNWEKVFPWIEK